MARGCVSLVALLWSTVVVFDWRLAGQDSALRISFGSSSAHSSASLGARLWSTVVVFSTTEVLDWSLVGQNSFLRLLVARVWRRYDHWPCPW